MNLLNLEDEKFKVIKIRNLKFKIRYISPKDFLRISRRRIELSGGSSINAMSEGEFVHTQNISIVDTCVEEMPEEFNQNESCAEWDDTSLIYEVADAIQKHTADIEAKLKKNRPVIGSAEE